MSTDSRDIPQSIFEILADMEHKRWAKWQHYLHEKCVKNTDGSLTIPAELVLHWERQINTSYSNLTDLEKQSDRELVESDCIRYLSILDILENFRRNADS